ncbi:MAG TPA: tripartite tricarboxylate transporter substrate-binding protein [Candidatus Binatia bacterium]|nr:tripartite tricarboxylate transporter substrate-binding protein [Candidatus Binatia bacterium]
MKIAFRTWILSATFFVLGGSQFAIGQESFYKGKTVRIVVGTSAGGGYDTFTRAIVRHLDKHIPGSPNIVVENMPGAGHRIGANHVYRVAKPDGLTLGHFQGSLFLAQALGDKNIEFDSRKFEFIGAPVRDTRACAVTRASGVTDMDTWFAAKMPLKLGGIGLGATEEVPRMLKAALGLPIQVVSGYKGTAEIRMAAESGEIAGGCWTWDSIKATWSKAISSGDAIVLLQILSKPHPELPKVPLAISYAKSEEARQLIQVGIQDPADYSRPYVAPPGTPKDRLQLLRKAFHETMKDPEFLADAKKSRLDIDPVSAEELEQTVAELFKLNPSLVAKLNQIFSMK